MLKRTFLAGVTAIALAVPAYAADRNTAATAMPNTMFIAKQAADERLANDIIGMAVEDVSGQKLGRVNDLVISPDAKVTGAVIGVGGFLGVGEKNVAVSFDQLKPKTVDNNEQVMTLNATKEELQNAPDYVDAEGKPISLSKQLADKARELGKNAQEDYNEAKQKASETYSNAKEQATEAYGKAKERMTGSDKDQSGARNQ
ncbi:MAG: PRC-barrel domain-containing protein [Rhodomicrobiaceae bacterium]